MARDMYNIYNIREKNRKVFYYKNNFIQILYMEALA